MIITVIHVNKHYDHLRLIIFLLFFWKCYITEHVPICMNIAKYIVIEKVSPVLCTTERSVPQYSTCITPSMVTQNNQ